MDPANTQCFIEILLGFSAGYFIRSMLIKTSKVSRAFKASIENRLKDEECWGWKGIIIWSKEKMQ